MQSCGRLVSSHLHAHCSRWPHYRQSLMRHPPSSPQPPPPTPTFRPPVLSVLQHSTMYCLTGLGLAVTNPAPAGSTVVFTDEDLTSENLVVPVTVSGNTGISSSTHVHLPCPRWQHHPVSSQRTGHRWPGTGGGGSAASAVTIASCPVPLRPVGHTVLQ